MRQRTATTLALLLAAALVGACNDDERNDVRADEGASSASASDTGDRPRGTPRYEAANATVLESPAHGPQLCLGGVDASLPPQCGGPDLVGWDWDAVDDEASRSGTTWGSYRVVGTYRPGGAFTLTEPPTPPLPREPQVRDFTSPCPAPAGGWTVVDDERLDVSAAIAHAEAIPGYAGGWVDQSINPATADGVQPREEHLLNDPTKTVLNIRFTDGEVAQREASVREAWGGPLCVTVGAERSQAELQAIRDELVRESGDQLLSVSTDEVRGRVVLGVIVDDGLQATLDERYGADTVVVHPALRRLD